MKPDNGQPATPETETQDPLMAALRDLPEHAAPRASGAARAAFVHAFDDIPWYTRLLARAERVAVPVVLVSVVGPYLVWAFTTAIALNQ